MGGARVPDPVYILRGSDDAITCLSFPQSSDDSLYSGSTNGMLYVWNMKTKRIVQSLNAHNGRSVLAVKFLPNGDMITQGRDGRVQFWSCDKEWSRSGHIQSSTLGFCAGCLMGKNTNMAVPSEVTSQVDIFDVHNRKLIGQLKPDEGETKYGTPMSIKGVSNTNSSQTQILIGYENGTVALWDTKNFKMVDCINCHDESVMCMCYSEDSNRGFSASVDSKIISWKIIDNDKLHQDLSVTITNPGLNDIVVRSDQKILATAGWDSQIRIFGMKKFRPLAVLSYHKDSVQCLTFSSDNYLGAGSKDKLISIWKIY